MKTFTNVASLKLAKLQAGQNVETQGYYTAGDGGAGRYLIVPAQAADEYGDHTLANGVVAVLQGQSYRSEQFGAVGGVDDTVAIQAAMDYSVGSILNITKAHNVDVSLQLMVPSDSHLVFLPGGSLTAITNALTDYAVLWVWAVSNVVIDNPILIGDYLTHTGVTGENGHCLEIGGGAFNVVVNNPDTSNAWGDGVYILDAVHLTMNKVTCNGNRRQGVSIIDGEDIVINGLRATNTTGSAPAAAVDIEPNNNTQRLKGIVINDVYSGANTIGVSIVPVQLDNTSVDVDITINGVTSRGDNRGVQLSTWSDVGGIITINDAKVFDAESVGVLLDKPNVNGPTIVINDPFVRNNNTSNNVSYRASSGILIAATPESVDTHVIGNIEINRPSISSSGTPKNAYGITFEDARVAPKGFQKIQINNPRVIETTDGTLKMAMIDWGSLGSDDIIITDKDEVFSVSPDGTNTIGPITFASVYSSENYTANGNANLSAALPIGTKVKFITGASVYTTRIVPTGSTVVPLTGYVSIIDSSVEGSSIVLLKTGATSWRVVEQIGTWVAS